MESEDEATHENFEKRPWWERGEFSLSPRSSGTGDDDKLGEEISKEEGDVAENKGITCHVEGDQTSDESSKSHYKAPALLNIFKNATMPIGKTGRAFEARASNSVGILREEGGSTIDKIGRDAWSRQEDFSLKTFNRSGEGDAFPREGVDERVTRMDYDDEIPVRMEYSSFDESSKCGDYKSSGLMNVYRSATVPIEVACLKLTLDDTTENNQCGRVQVEWHGDGSHQGASDLSAMATSPLKTPSSAGQVNRARASAVIRRRQQRRHRLRSQGSVVNCLNAILTVLHFTGFSPYLPQKGWKPGKGLTLFFKVIYWVFLTTAVLHAMRDVKYDWIKFRTRNTLGGFSDLGISLVILLARLCSVKLFWGNKQKLGHVVEIIDDLDCPPCSNWKKNTYRVAIGFLIATSFMLATASVLFGWMEFQEWTFIGQQKQMAFEIAQDLFIWSPCVNGTTTTEILSQKGINMNGITVVLSTLGDIMSFIGNLHENIMIDFWTLVAGQAYVLQVDLKRTLDELSQDDSGIEQVWDLYLERRAIYDELNAIIHPVLKVAHISNILRLSKCLFNLFTENASPLRFIMIANLIKVGFCYWLCLKVSATNEQLEAAVVNHADTTGFVPVNGHQVNLCTLRGEMKMHQLGLGRGNFFVDESFLIKITCASWSVFLLVAEHAHTPDN